MTTRPTRHAADSCRPVQALASGRRSRRLVAERAGADRLDWKRFKGEKIEILLVKSPRATSDQVSQGIEDLTGMRSARR